jgi:acetyltransferase-like isoleucine patch superfamily enzyme
MKSESKLNNSVQLGFLDEELRSSRAARILWRLARMFKLRRRRAVVSFLISLICRWEGGEAYSRTARIILRDWYEIEVGLGSYGSLFRPGAFGGATRVGRYTSIAPNVHTIERNHPVNWASTSSVFYDPRLGVVTAETLPDYEPLVIGHDVWIGWGAILLPGCRRIGDGAVIGAGSVVNKDIPDYAIAAGVPARVLRYRFDEATRNALKASEWWTLVPSQLNRIAAEFLHELSPSNVSAFQDAVQAARERLT